MNDYLIPSEDSSIEFSEKKSRFIAHCQHVSSETDFKRFLQTVKRQYPDARHHCYGFRIGPMSSALRGFSDDGEPNGTAGMPILNVIDHSDFSDIAIIVVRYFGGIKLGTGGLTRAYSKACKMALENQPFQRFEQKNTLLVACEFRQENQLRHILNELNGRIIDIQYQLDVQIKAELNEEGCKHLEELNFSTKIL